MISLIERYTVGFVKNFLRYYFLWYACPYTSVFSSSTLCRLKCSKCGRIRPAYFYLAEEGPICFSCYCKMFKKKSAQLSPQVSHFFDDENFYYYLDIARAVSGIKMDAIDRWILRDYIHQLSCSDSADKLQISRQAVHKRLNRIFEKIVDFLEGLVDKTDLR